MASAPQTLPPPRTSLRGTPRLPGRASGTGGDPLAARRRAGLGRRHALRLALGVPYLVLAAWAVAHGARPPADVALDAAVLAHPSSGAWFARAVPLLPGLVARALPGGTGALIGASALCAGGVLQLVASRLVRAGLDRVLLAIALAAIAGMPLFWASIGGSFATAAGLACISVAFAGGVDFVISRRTSGGYAAGISLAGAVLCDPGTLGCVLALVVATWTVTTVRRRAEPHVARSLTAVLLFPTIAVVLGSAFLEWRLTGSGAAPLAVIGLGHWPHPSLAGLLGAGRTTALALVCSPVFAVSGTVTGLRRPITALGFAAMPVALVLQGSIGLTLPLGAVVLVLSLFGTLVLPRAPGRSVSLLVCSALVAGSVSSTLLVTQTTPALRALGL